jgi:hypothetical protein
MIHYLKWLLVTVLVFSEAHTTPKNLQTVKIQEKLSKPYVQTLPFNPHEQLTASLSKTGLTRLCVEGDRVASLFVETGVLTQVADEASGQWFIQPTQPERKQPITLSIITLNGHTQDLKLTVTDIPSAAIRLQMPKRDTPLPNELFQESGKEEKPLILLKAVMQNQITAHPQRTIPNRKHRSAWASVRYQKEYHIEGYIISQWRVTNHRAKSIILQENDFYEPGDIALTSIHHHLSTHASTTLFIIRGV